MYGPELHCHAPRRSGSRPTIHYDLRLGVCPAERCRLDLLCAIRGRRKGKLGSQAVAGLLWVMSHCMGTRLKRCKSCCGLLIWLTLQNVMRRMRSQERCYLMSLYV